MSQPASDSSHSQVVSYATPVPTTAPTPTPASPPPPLPSPSPLPSSPHHPSRPASPPPPSSTKALSNKSSSTRSTASATSSAASVEEHLERLTSAVQEVGHLVHVCTQLCEARCAAARARDEAQRARAVSVQEQLARMLAMTQETVRREREVRVAAASDPQKYVLDLRRAAFGAGSTADSISRSSMMESSEYSD